MKGKLVNQIEFFDLIKSKKMKEALITLECGCEILYSPVSEEIFGYPCPNHEKDM